ncbi:MAG: hypothetical protein RSC00_04690, partial [Ruthenibacterium sp.]
KEDGTGSTLILLNFRSSARRRARRRRQKTTLSTRKKAASKERIEWKRHKSFGLHFLMLCSSTGFKY